MTPTTNINYLLKSVVIDINKYNICILQQPKISVIEYIGNVTSIERFLNQFIVISNWISLFSKNIEGDLMPVYDYFLDNGLFEVNENGEIQPTTGSKADVMFELINNEIIPRI